MFCTNGVLLRALVTNGSAIFNKLAPRKLGKDDISDITHIIVVLIVSSSTNVLAHAPKHLFFNYCSDLCFYLFF